ncbi:acetylserotonin O-methyltransferase [Actinoallomurus purpureus]|uniref:acetylserotonin O-methyltransferase n=1 Tax=Actinoallomurus purpureus TaxID=478114 RepID=UPI0020937202|nr:acetylserotonin O-methyltransferase [Actinoallomurus purpureus]MCO6009759.1 acetylserotonin O-methyltransferase [Actinoallomurus purpureus]
METFEDEHSIGEAGVAGDTPLEDIDVERIRRVMDFTRSLSTGELLAEILPSGTPAHVAAEIARHCRVAHGSVMVFTSGPSALAAPLTGIGLNPGAPRPSTVVHERVARRYGIPEADLQVQIVHAAISGNESGHVGEIEIFLCSVGSGERFQRLLDDERRANHETHFAIDVAAPEPHLTERLWELLTGPAGMTPDGGGFNPYEGPAGRTVLYFRTEGLVAPQGWPRRLELLVDGDHELLATHLRSAESSRPARTAPEPPADEEATRRMLDLLTGAWTTQALCAAAELGIADHLKSHPATSAELATLTNADPDLMHRILRYLESLGVLRRDGRRWSLTGLGMTLRTGALRDVARLYGGIFYRSFGSLSHSVRTGENAFEHALGMPPFDYLNEHPDQASVFHGAMAAGSSWFSGVPEVIDFTDAGTVVDVAGGHGDLLRHILMAAPAARGVLFDQPAVVDAAREELEKDDLLDRCEVIGGDFTEWVPEGGDVYLLSRILHDWDDEQCLKILANCRQAMSETARLVIIERPIPTDGTPSLAIAWDVHMAVNNIGGRERTHEEYRRLLRVAGFRLVDTRPLALDMAALTAVPADGS